MKQIKLMSKFVLAALVATIVAFSAMTVPSLVAQPGPPRDGGGGPPIPDSFITSEMIGDGEVQTEDLADNAVTSPKIADGTIEEEDIADGVIPPAGGTGQLLVTQRSTVLEDEEPGAFIGGALCNSDEVVTGGGFRVLTSFSQEVNIVENNKPATVNGWAVSGSHSAGVPVDITISVYCAKIVP